MALDVKHKLLQQFSVDNENEYDVLSLNAASLGLQLAGIPLESPVGAVRMSLLMMNGLYKLRIQNKKIQFLIWS